MVYRNKLIDNIKIKWFKSKFNYYNYKYSLKCIIHITKLIDTYQKSDE